MSRLFDGTDDQMVYAIPSSGGPNFTYGTALMVCKFATTVDNTWQSLIEMETAGGSLTFAMGRRNNGALYYANQSTLDAIVSIDDSDGWMLVAVTKATGSAAPTSHKIPLATGVRTSTAQLTSTVNSNSAASGNLRIGGNDDPASIYVAAVAIFVGTVLTTTQLDAIAAAKTTQAILGLSPTWCVDDSDSLATDLTSGTVDRTSITGTTDSADDPAGWVYGVGGGTSAVSADRQLAYDVEGALSATRQIAYDTEATVTTERQVAYDTRGDVTSLRAVDYDLKAMTAGTVLVAYDHEATVAAERQLSYDMGVNVADERLLLYTTGDLVAGPPTRPILGAGI